MQPLARGLHFALGRFGDGTLAFSRIKASEFALLVRYSLVNLLQLVERSNLFSDRQSEASR
jgi:hypothetical protein